MVHEDVAACSRPSQHSKIWAARRTAFVIANLQCKDSPLYQAPLLCKLAYIRSFFFKGLWFWVRQEQPLDENTKRAKQTNCEQVIHLQTRERDVGQIQAREIKARRRQGEQTYADHQYLVLSVHSTMLPSYLGPEHRLVVHGKDFKRIKRCELNQSNEKGAEVLEGWSDNCSLYFGQHNS